jgi:hypothetical protein
MMEDWIEEFLYRGRPPTGPDSDTPPAFHVIIGQQVDSPFGDGEKQRRMLGPMTLAKAADLGHNLTGIVEGINEAAISRIDELEEQLAAETQRADTAEAALAASEVTSED